MGYLILPNLIFSASWFRQPYSAVLVAGYLVLTIRQLTKARSDNDNAFNFKEIIILSAFALTWTILSGVGGLVYQSSDFLYHNVKFYDLFRNSWPNYIPEIDRFSRYYYGYYLVPALASKLAGQLLPSVLFGWSALGYFIAVSWVYHLINRNMLFLFSFIWVRGIGHIIAFSLKKMSIAVAPFYMAWFRAIFEQSCWVPNQLIATIIITCMVLNDNFDRSKTEDSFLPITLGFIFGIFPSIILVLLFVPLFVNRYFVKGRLSELFTRSSLYSYWLPGVLVIPTLLYFLSSDSTPIYGFLWKFDSNKTITFFYAIGFLIDWFLFYKLLHYTQKKIVWIPAWYIHILFALLLFVSLFRIGINNDWFYRGQIPFFIIINIGIFKGLSTFIKQRFRNQQYGFYIPLFILIFSSSLQLIFSSHLLRDNALVKTLFPTYTTFTPFPDDRFPNIYQALKYIHPTREADAEQYLGKKGSFYEKHLARIPEH